MFNRGWGGCCCCCCCCCSWSFSWSCLFVGLALGTVCLLCLSRFFLSLLQAAIQKNLKAATTPRCSTIIFQVLLNSQGIVWSILRFLPPPLCVFWCVFVLPASHANFSSHFPTVHRSRPPFPSRIGQSSPDPQSPTSSLGKSIHCWDGLVAGWLVCGCHFLPLTNYTHKFTPHLKKKQTWSIYLSRNDMIWC